MVNISFELNILKFPNSILLGGKRYSADPGLLVLILQPFCFES